MDASSKNIHFENLTYTTSTGGPRKADTKIVLDSISGLFRSGELTAIMGPSGAGKSSLLNILTGFTRNGVTGTLNMDDIRNSSKQLGRHCSYILQEDNLYADFSVQETMWLAANLKIGYIGPEKKQQMIDLILDSLHLRHTKRTYCNTLSGGQRKRLSIALELLDNRPILFLDEPTTGLDSLSAAHCIRLLHNLAHEGRTIVCTIHQPAGSVFEMFDQVYVLAGGHSIYQGSAANTVAFLSANGLHCPQYHNSADFLLEVANGEYGNFTKQLASSAVNLRWRKPLPSASGDMILSHMDTIRPMISTVDVYHEPPSEWTKFCVLVRRCHIHYHRDWTVTYLKWFLHVFTAITMGMMYGDSGTNAVKSIANVSLLCATNMYMWYTAIMPAVLKFPTELAIIKKETFNHWYKLRTYFMANMLITAPIHLVFSVSFSTVVYALTDQPVEFDRFLKFTLIYILLNIIGDAMGLIIGALLDPINGTFVGAVLTVYKIALCGFFAMPSQVSEFIRAVMNLSSLSYSMEALALSLYEGNRPNMVCPPEKMYCHYVSPDQIINLIGFRRGNYSFDVVMLLVQLVLFKFVAYYALRSRVKK